MRYIIILFSILIFLSCKKIQERKIISGKFLVENVHSDAVNADNAMDFLIPGYISDSNCCKYYVDFFDDETATGTFYKYDVIMQIDSGFWNLKKFNRMHIQLGRFINGNYKIDRKGRKKIDLISSDNEAIFITNQPPIISNVTMKIKRF